MRRRFNATFSKVDEEFDTSKYVTLHLYSDAYIEVRDYRNVFYGIDGKGWVALKNGERTPIIKAGHTVSIKAYGRLYIEQPFIHCDAKFQLTGNCMSLLYGDSGYLHNDLTGHNRCFDGLFSHSKVMSVSTDFLPATTLSPMCYSGMFMYCDVLQNAPVLPAITLVDKCYSYMFYGCSKLRSITMLATDMSASNCMDYWVYGLPNEGMFVKNTNAYIYSHASGIPKWWAVVDDYGDSSANMSFAVYQYKGELKVYTAKKRMTWGEFLNSDYNPTYEENGDKAFIINESYGTISYGLVVEEIDVFDNSIIYDTEYHEISGVFEYGRGVLPTDVIENVTYIY